jgi:hypothetical protein
MKDRIKNRLVRFLSLKIGYCLIFYLYTGVSLLRLICVTIYLTNHSLACEPKLYENLISISESVTRAFD